MQSSRLDARLIRVHHARPETPTLQEPSLVFILSGRKRGRIGTQSFEYQAGQCLIVGLPLLFHCETPAVADEVTLALVLPIDWPTLRSLLREQQRATPAVAPPGPDQLAISVTDLDRAGHALIRRVLDAMQGVGDEAETWQTQLKLYRALLACDAMPALLSATCGSQSAHRIRDAIDTLHKRYASDLDVSSLASSALMSESAFHKAFKALTGQTPMRYLKAYRLHEARRLISQHSQHIAQVAFAVGYKSPTQFSRDFSQHFGHPPGDTRRHPPSAD